MEREGHSPSNLQIPLTRRYFHIPIFNIKFPNSTNPAVPRTNQTPADTRTIGHFERTSFVIRITDHFDQNSSVTSTTDQNDRIQIPAKFNYTSKYVRLLDVEENVRKTLKVF